MPVSRVKLVTAVALAILLGAATFFTATWVARELRTSPDTATVAGGSVPEHVYNAPDTVPTTSTYGPVGAVSLVFAGNDVLTGLTGHLADPWIAVSSQTGDYRALSVPHRPAAAPGAMSVSADGTALAWGWAGGAVVYDAVEDETHPVTGFAEAPVVGAFSPSGERLAVFDGSLRVVDVRTQEVVATLRGVTERAARQAVWTTDGAALTYVDDGRLVTHEWRSDERADVPTQIPPDATLRWSPSGEQLAAMRMTRGVKVVDVFQVAEDGRLALTRTLRPEKHSMQRLLGFTSENSVSVTALRLDSGSIEQVFQVSTTDTSTPLPVMQLPGPGVNWAGSQTLAVAAKPLAHGSVAFEEPQWPWSDVSKLVVSAVFALFVLGLYLTRRAPRRMRRG
ncbi:MAG TPA: hypothetical protein VFJ14_12665 [Nocardioidaceae bacterium]|nr:hypothetical protein [Nocardioidaceae bacterium]